MYQIDDVYKWLVRIYAHKYPNNPLDQLNLDIAKIENEVKSRERAVLELALQNGLRLIEIERLEGEGRTREEAILEFLKGKKLQLTEDDWQIQEMVKGSSAEGIFKPSVGGVATEKPVTGPWNWRVLAKYFVHGLAYSVLMLFLIFLWAFALVFLLVAGAFIGLIIGFVVLLLIVGGLNSFLAGTIWSIETRTGWMSLLGHGLMLLVVLAILHIPTLVVSLIVPSLPLLIVLFFAEVFIDGFVAKNVAGLFEEEY